MLKLYDQPNTCEEYNDVANGNAYFDLYDLPNMCLDFNDAAMNIMSLILGKDFFFYSGVSKLRALRN